MLSPSFGCLNITVTPETWVSGSVATLTRVSAWLGMANSGRGGAGAAAFTSPSLSRTHCSARSGSTSPTTTTAMRSGRYHSCANARRRAGSNVRITSGRPMGRRSA